MLETFLLGSDLKMTRILTSFLAVALSSSAAFAGGHCAAGLTIEEDTLTIATGNPAYFPWVIDDAPESGQGFEAAVAYAVAERMGFEKDAVAWVRSSFDEAIQPGKKDFDFNLQQYSITDERDEIVDFSMPYYSAAMAVITRAPVVEGGAEASLESLKTLKWGAHASTTAVPMLAEVVQSIEFKWSLLNTNDGLYYGIIKNMNFSSSSIIIARFFEQPLDYNFKL